MLVTHVLVHGPVQSVDRGVEVWFAARRTGLWNSVTMFGADMPETQTAIAGWSALEGVPDLRAVLLDVALGLITAASGPQPPVPGEAADGFHGGAFERFGPVRDLLADAHGWLPFVACSAGTGAPAGASGPGLPVTDSGGST